MENYVPRNPNSTTVEEQIAQAEEDLKSLNEKHKLDVEGVLQRQADERRAEEIRLYGEANAFDNGEREDRGKRLTKAERAEEESKHQVQKRGHTKPCSMIAHEELTDDPASCHCNQK